MEYISLCLVDYFGDTLEKRQKHSGVQILQNRYYNTFLFSGIFMVSKTLGAAEYFQSWSRLKLVIYLCMIYLQESLEALFIFWLTVWMQPPWITKVLPSSMERMIIAWTRLYLWWLLFVLRRRHIFLLHFLLFSATLFVMMRRHVMPHALWIFKITSIANCILQVNIFMNIL